MSDNILIAAFGDQLIRYDVDGNRIWSAALPFSGPNTVTATEDSVFTVDVAGNIVKFDLDSGAQIWNTDTGISLFDVAIASDGSAWIAANGGDVVRVDSGGTLTLREGVFVTSQAANGIHIVDGRIYLAGGDFGAIAEIDETGTALKTVTGLGKASRLTFLDGELLVSSGTSVERFDLELNSIGSIATAGVVRALDPAGSGEAWVLDDGDNTLSRIDIATGAKLIEITGIENSAGGVFDYARGSGVNAFGASFDAGSVEFYSGGDQLWSAAPDDPASDKLKVVYIESGAPGPTTKEEIFQATYANASAAPPKRTALVRPLDVQRSIDTDVSWLARNPKTWTVEAPIRLGEADFYRPGNVFWVQANLPGLREGRKVVFKGFAAKDIRPTELAAMVFTAPSEEA